MLTVVGAAMKPNMKLSMLLIASRDQLAFCHFPNSSLELGEYCGLVQDVLAQLAKLEIPVE